MIGYYVLLLQFGKSSRINTGIFDLPRQFYL